MNNALKIKTFSDITLFQWDRLLILQQQCVKAFFKQRVVGHVAQSAPSAVAVTSTQWHSYRKRNTPSCKVQFVNKRKKYPQPCLTNSASPL
jgi:hypothetical protein